MKQSLQKIVNAWESAAGYEVLGKHKIKDRKSLASAICESQRWLEDHLQEIIRKGSQVCAALSK